MFVMKCSWFVWLSQVSHGYELPRNTMYPNAPFCFARFMRSFILPVDTACLSSFFMSFADDAFVCCCVVVVVSVFCICFSAFSSCFVMVVAICPWYGFCVASCVTVVVSFGFLMPAYIAASVSMSVSFVKCVAYSCSLWCSVFPYVFRDMYCAICSFSLSVSASAVAAVVVYVSAFHTIQSMMRCISAFMRFDCSAFSKDVLNPLRYAACMSISAAF